MPGCLARWPTPVRGVVRVHGLLRRCEPQVLLIVHNIFLCYVVSHLAVVWGNLSWWLCILSVSGFPRKANSTSKPFRFLGSGGKNQRKLFQPATELARIHKADHVDCVTAAGPAVPQRHTRRW